MKLCEGGKNCANKPLSDSIGAQITRATGSTWQRLTQNWDRKTLAVSSLRARPFSVSRSTLTGKLLSVERDPFRRVNIARTVRKKRFTTDCDATLFNPPTNLLAPLVTLNRSIFRRIRSLDYITWRINRLPAAWPLVSGHLVSRRPVKTSGDRR